MKKLSLLVLISCFLMKGHSQGSYPYFFTPDMNNQKLIQSKNIHEERIFEYSVKGRKLKDSTLREEIGYDSLGNVLVDVLFGADELFVWSDSDYYNIDHRLIKKVSNSTTDVYTTLFEYDSSGNETMRTLSSQDSVLYVITQRLYNKDHLLTYITQSWNGKHFNPISKFLYNEKKQLIEQDELGPNMKLTSALYFSYDTSGLPSNVVRQDDHGKNLINTYLFDNDHHCTQNLFNMLIQTAVYNLAPRYDFVPGEEHFWYNKNGLLFQADIVIKDKTIQLRRHYYE